MKTIYGINIAQTLEEVCDPRQVALLVYDMQVGILSQIKNPEQITGRFLKCWALLAALEYACSFPGICRCQKN